MRQLELQLLSFPEFRLDGRGIQLALRKAAALVIYLAEAGGPVSREVAATLLWPEADADSARARLRRTLHKIGLAFGEKIVAASGASIRLQSEFAVGLDSHAFEHACDTGRLAEAADLYKNDYLDGF